MADQKRDYYSVLGVSKGAGDDELKKAYRKLAKENHPDLHPGDTGAEARFKEVNEAYEILSDKDKRARYDRFGHAGVDPSFQAGGGAGGFGGFEDLDLGDLFGSFFGGGFGGGTRRGGPQKGESLRVNLTLSFEEAAFGCEREIQLTHTATCGECKGSGSAPGTTAETCADCRGTGSVRIQQGGGAFSFSTVAACPKCRGTGKVIHTPCKVCAGAGAVRKQEKIKVTIPAGIDNGQAVSLRGQGNAGKSGGPPGDLIVGVSVRAHPRFQREGVSVYLEQPVSFLQAALGDEIEIDTIDGKVKYTVPEGTQTGTVFRLRGKGIPDINGRGRGDQFVTVTVQVPKGLTAEQKKALRDFGESMGAPLPGAADGGSKSFFDKRKKKK